MGEQSGIDHQSAASIVLDRRSFRTVPDQPGQAARSNAEPTFSGGDVQLIALWRTQSLSRMSFPQCAFDELAIDNAMHLFVFFSFSTNLTYEIMLQKPAAHWHNKADKTGIKSHKPSINTRKGRGGGGPISYPS